MPLTINTNLASLGGLRQLDKSTKKLSSLFERLSSGQRINRASDDAAGLAIADSLRADRRIFDQAVRNVNDAVSMISIGESALGELSNITIRQRELAEQAANGVYSFEQRKALDAEAAELTEEFNRIVQTARFNGIDLFSDSAVGTVNIEAGYGADGSLQASFNQALQRTIGTGDFGTASGSAGPTAIDRQLVDLDVDGDLDIVTVDSGTGHRYFLNDGSGSFASAVTIDTIGALNVAIGDFDGNGSLDTATVRNGTNELRVNISNAELNYSLSQVTGLQEGSGGSLKYVFAEDLTGDGFDDLIVMHHQGSGANPLEVYHNDGRGNFSYRESIADVTAYQGQVAFGDVDNDGDLDLATRGNILLNGGDGTFSVGQTVLASPGTNGVTGDQLVDFDRDGNLDYLVGRGANASGSDRLNIAFGQGDGTFGAVQTLSVQGTGTRFLDIGVADFNGDGYSDVAAHDVQNNIVEIFMNDGQGTLTSTSQTASTGTVNQKSLAAGDIDGDGVVELGSNNGFHRQVTSETSTVQRLNLLSQESALEALDILDAQLERVSLELGNLGADTARMQVAASVLRVQSENFSSAESQIRDADIAKEAAELTRATILQQAAASVLAQANQQPTLALSLLG